MLHRKEGYGVKGIAKLLFILFFAATTLVAAPNSSPACEWTGYSYQGCWRIDYYSCPVYVYVNGVFVYVGEYEWAEGTWRCALV